MDIIKPFFDRKPYTIMYYKDGEKIVKKRRPPPALHEMLPQDVVTLTHKKNDDFDVGEKYVVKHISQRSPNTIQIKDNDGKATFVPYYYLNLEKKIAIRPGEEKNIPSDYLLWP